MRGFRTASVSTVLASWIWFPVAWLPAPAPDVHSGRPPSSAMWSPSCGYPRIRQQEGEIVGDVLLDPERKRAFLRWQYAPLGPGEEYASKDLSYAARYWPTTAFVLDSNRIVIAGKEPEPGNKTVIEVWTFSSATGSYVRGPGGEITWNFTAPTRTAVDVVYSDGVVGRDMVYGLAKLRGASPETFLVHFYDSKDVYSLQPGTGRIALVASPSSASGAPLVVPQLANPALRFAYSSEHLSHGHIYVFDQVGAKLPEHDVLVLLDSDKDAQLDSALYVSDEEWVSMGFADSNNYADY